MRRRIKNVCYEDDYCDEDDYYDDDDEEDNDEDYNNASPEPHPRQTVIKQTTETSRQAKPIKHVDQSHRQKVSTSKVLKKKNTTKNALVVESIKDEKNACSVEGSTGQSIQDTTCKNETTLVDDIDIKDDNTRTSLNLVVVGHVDAGKSTLLGHFLLKKGYVSSRQFHQFRQESRRIGKESFVYAWVLDEGEDERDRGITIDVCVKQFQTTTKNICVLDAPGHKEFVPNMLMAAVQADVALLVVDAKNFNAGFSKGGQTKEHIQLVRALGIQKVVIAINKMDTVGWSQEKFEYISHELLAFITGPDVGFKSSAIEIVPLSAFIGINLTNATDDEDLDVVCPELYTWWNKQKTLEAILDDITLDIDSYHGRYSPIATDQLAVCIADVWANTTTKTTVSAKVESGFLSVNTPVVVLPSRQICKVTDLQLGNHQKVSSCNKGQYIERLVLDVEPQYVQVGSVLCTIKYPLPVVTNAVAKIVVFDVETPILPGLQLMAYIHMVGQPVKVLELLASFNKANGKKEPRKPRILLRGDIALIELSFPSPTCIDYQKKGCHASKLSRIILRHRGATAAAGMLIDPSDYHHRDEFNSQS